MNCVLVRGKERRGGGGEVGKILSSSEAWTKVELKWITNIPVAMRHRDLDNSVSVSLSRELFLF